MSSAADAEPHHAEPDSTERAERYAIPVSRITALVGLTAYFLVRLLDARPAWDLRPTVAA